MIYSFLSMSMSFGFCVNSIWIGAPTGFPFIRSGDVLIMDCIFLIFLGFVEIIDYLMMFWLGSSADI